MTFELVAKAKTLTTVANTDIFTDIAIKKAGLLHISIGATTAADLRITLDGTNYQTIQDVAADIHTTITIAVSPGDTLNFQTVAIEVLDLTVLIET